MSVLFRGCIVQELGLQTQREILCNSHSVCFDGDLCLVPFRSGYTKYILTQCWVVSKSSVLGFKGFADMPSETFLATCGSGRCSSDWPSSNLWGVEPVHQTETFFQDRWDRQLPPLVWLYRGCSSTAVHVSHGPCLKVDLSTRVVQEQSVLDYLAQSI
jgi:hypothetical protein